MSHIGTPAPRAESAQPAGARERPLTRRSAHGHRFPRVEGRRWGYTKAEVEKLLEPFGTALTGSDADLGAMLDAVPADRLPGSRDLRRAVFARERGGYDPRSVDRALGRLDEALQRREKRQFIRDHGREAWHERVADLSDLVVGRLERPDGRRFRSPAGTSSRGYSKPEVDALCSWVLDELSTNRPPDPRQIRAAVFPPARGPQGYEEQQTDAFLEALTELLGMVD